MINYNRWSYGNYQLVSPIPSDNAPRWSNGGILLLHEAESSTNITITHITSVLNVSINNHNYLIDTVINHISKYISFTVNTHSIVTIEDVLITHSASNLNFISGTHNVIIDNIYNHAINNITVSTNSHQVNIDNVIIHTASVIALETKTHTALIDEVISHEFSNFTLSAGSHTALSDISVLHSSSSISFTPNNHTVLLTAVIEHASSTIEYTLGTHNIITDSLIQHTLSSLQFSTGSHNVLTDTIIEHQSTTFTLTSNTHTAIIGYIYPHTASSITYTIGVHEVTSDNIINHNTNSIEFNTGSHTISADLIVLHTSESFVLTVGSHAVGSDVIVNHSTNQIEFISGVHSITVDRVITHSTNSIEFTTLSHETYTDVIISHTSQAFAFTTGTHATGADLIVNHSYSALTFTSNSHTISVDQIITHSSISLEFTSNSHTVASDIIVSHALSSIEYSIGTHVATEDIIVSHVAQSVIYSIGSHSITISASVIHATTGIQFTLGSHTIFSDIVVNHGSSLINFTAGTHSVIADIVISHTLSEFELSSNTHTVTADRVIDHSASSINFTAGSHNALTDTYITHSVSSIEFSTNKHIISVDVIVSHAVSTFEFTPGTHTVIISEIIEHSTTSIEFTPQSHDLILDVVILPSTTSFVFTPGIHVYAIDLFIEHVTTVLKFHINTNRITTTSQIPHHGSAELTLDDLVGKEVTPEILQSLTTEGRVSFPLKDTQTSAVSQGEDQLDPDGTTTTEGNVDEYIDSIKENEDMVKMLEDMRDDMLKDMKIPPANADIADAAKQLGSPDGTITANIWATAQTIMDIIHQTQTGNCPVLGAITGNGSITGDFIKCSDVTQAIADNWKTSVNGDPATSDELHKQNSMSSVQQAKESFSTKMKNMYLYIRDMLWWNLIWARLVIFFIELLEKVVAIPIDTPFLILRFFKKLTPDNYQKYGPIHKMLNRLKILLLCRVPVNAFSEYKPDEDIQVWYPIGKNGKFMSLRELCSQSTTVKECPPGQSPWPDETNNQGTWAKDSAEQKLASVKNILVNNFDNSDTCIPTSFIDNLFKKSNIKGPGMSPDCAEAAKKVIEAVQDDALHFGEYEGIIIEPDPEATVIIADTTPINEVISKNFIGLGPDQETSTFAKSGTATSFAKSGNATSFAKSGNATSVGGSIGIGTGLKSRKKEEEFDFYELPTSSSDTDRIASIMRTAILTGAGSDMNSVYYNLNDVTIDGMTNEPVYPLDITANLVDASLFINGVTYDLDSWIDSSGNETVIRTGNDGYSVSYNTDGLYISIKWNNTADNSGFDLNGEDSIIYKYWVD